MRASFLCAFRPDCSQRVCFCLGFLTGKQGRKSDKLETNNVEGVSICSIGCWQEKLKEAAASVLPVTAIVAVLCLALVRVDVGLMLSFLLGSGLLIVGMGLFTLGAGALDVAHRQLNRREDDKVAEALVRAGCELPSWRGPSRWRSPTCRCWRRTFRQSTKLFSL